MEGKRFKCTLKGCRKSYKTEKELDNHKRKHHLSSSTIKGTCN